MPVLPPSKPITLASYHRLEKLGNTHTNPIQMFSCSSFHPSPSTNNTNKNPLKIFHLCGKPASCTQSSLAYAPSTSTILCLSPLISSVHASTILIEHTKQRLLLNSSNDMVQNNYTYRTALVVPPNIQFLRKSTIWFEHPKPEAHVELVKRHGSESPRSSTDLGDLPQAPLSMPSNHRPNQQRRKTDSQFLKGYSEEQTQWLIDFGCFSQDSLSTPWDDCREDTSWRLIRNSSNDMVENKHGD